MPNYQSAAIRNISLVGQTGGGKTTLVEALLAHAGAIASAGSVTKGNTVSDFDPLEKEYQHSLSASLTSIDHERIHTNIIDTPGLPDFIGQAIATFPAVETVAVVINAVNGVEVVDRRMLNWAAERKLCRMIIVNKIDDPQADAQALVESIRQEFGSQCLPLNLPAEGGSTVIDCFFNVQGQSDFSSVEQAHTQIVDQVVEVDEEMMELYLEQGQALQPEQLHDPFEKALREGHLVPICFVSSQTGAGIPQLLEVFERLMPNPMEGNPRPFLLGEGEAAKPFFATPDPEQHVVAHVFKITADPFVGKLGIFRIHQGMVTNGKQLFIGDGRKPIKVNHLFKLQGKQQLEVDQGIPGDICALAKVEELHFDAILHDSHEEDYLHLKPLDFPVPVFGLAIQARNRGDEQRLSNALGRLVEEDPCLRVDHNAGTNETVLLGLGELHLRLTLERMQQRFNVEVDTSTPQIAYRETIRKSASGHYRHKKQTGGAGQFGEVFLKVEPLEPKSGIQFVDETKGGVIPGPFIPAVEKGVRQATLEGAVAGYPLQDLRVVLYDGKSHSVDSKEIAFVTAGKRAVLDAVKKAAPAILEPVVQMDMVVPNESMGAVSGDISAKRGQLMGTHALSGGMLGIVAQVPMAEISEFANDLNRLTGGRGTYTLEFSHYQQVPEPVQRELAAAYQPAAEED